MLNLIITLTFLSTLLARLGLIGETGPGLFHIVVGVMAFYHAVASLTQAFTGHQLVPLGPAILQGNALA
jgi:hypothetical protein